MTDIILLTGFLGAGKTTLLRRLMRAFRNKRVAVVANDYGAINVDAELVAADEPSGPTLEITDGSLFCSCRQHEFVEGLRLLSEHPLDMVLVEASGLGDPANFGVLLAETAKFWPELSYRGTVAVADLDAIADVIDLLPACTRQIELADVIIANKADLVGEEELDAGVRLLDSLNPNATILITSWCEIEVPTLLDVLRPGAVPGLGETTNRCDNPLPSARLVCDEPVDPVALTAFLREVAPATLRIKGFLPSPEGWSEVSCVGASVMVRSRTVAPEHRGLVLIATDTRRVRLDVVKGWEAHVGLPVRVA